MPCLILDNNQSLHNYNLKPSDGRKLKEADILFMIDYDFEVFMQKAAKSLLKKKATIVELAKNPSLVLLKSREFNLFEDGHDHHHNIYDYHIWLDPDNAINIINKICEVLSTKDPPNAGLYNKNALETSKKIRFAAEDLATNLNHIYKVPYLVFHDAYQYLEHKYQLNSIGAISLTPHKIIGAKSMRKIHKIIEHNQVKCIFSEPEFPATTVQNLAKNFKLKIGVLSAEWQSGNYPAHELYFILLNNLKLNLINCLS